MSAGHTNRDAGLPEPMAAQLPLLFDCPSAVREASAQGAPDAPVSRPAGEAGTMTLEACYARHTGPQGAIIAAVLGLLAAWAVRVADQGLIFADNPEGSPRR